MVNFSLILQDSDTNTNTILSNKLNSPCLPRQGDSLVFNSIKYLVERVIFNFEEEQNSIIIIVKKANINNINVKNNQEELNDYSILSMIM